MLVTGAPALGRVRAPELVICGPVDGFLVVDHRPAGRHHGNPRGSRTLAGLAVAAVYGHCATTNS